MTRRTSNLSIAHASRGLTLLEVLAATILLALLAATCSPIVAKAMAIVRQDKLPTSAASAVRLPELGEVADAFMADPKLFGIGKFDLHEIEHVEFTCPSSGDAGTSISLSLSGRMVRVERIVTAANDAKHLWLVFECEDAKILRWVPVPEDSLSEQRIGGPS